MKNNEKNKEYIKHAWTVLCQNSSTDSQTNFLSLFNIIEEITIDLPIDYEKQIDKDGLSVIPVQFKLVSLWNRVAFGNEILIGDVKVVFKDPEGNNVQDFTYTLNIPSDKRRMRFNVDLNGLKINLNKSGNYIFEINIKGPNEISFQKVAEIPLCLIINKSKK